MIKVNFKRLFGVDGKMVWAVRWKDGKGLRQREFDHEFEARAHYQKLGHNLISDRQLLKSYREGWLKALMGWKFAWLGRSWSVWVGLAMWTAMVALIARGI